MKKKPASRSAFFNPRFLTGFALCAIGVFLALAVGRSAPEDRTPIKSRFEGYTGQTTTMPVNSSLLAPPAVAKNEPVKIAQPSAPDVTLAILYDQLNNAATTGSNSQEFEAANVTFNSFLGDDFVVPAAQTWTIQQVVVQGLYFNGPGPAASFNVFFHTNTGTLPMDPAVATRLANSYVESPTGTFTITLASNVVLTSGVYWVSVQARQDFTPAGQWGWLDRTVQSNSAAAFKNPGGGFACPGGAAWAIKTSCIPTAGGPDQVFQILGTTGAGSPTPTPTPVASATPSPVASCTPGGAPGPWATAAPAPPARYRSGGVTDGTNIYVFGGGNATTQLNDLWRWSPATQTWTQLANMPTAKQNIQGAYWNGKIYVPGGFTTAHITENAIYDIASNTWSTGAPLPTAQTGTNVAFNNKIYNFGGNPGPQATTSIYDIASNTWSTGAAMPVATTYGRAVVSGGFAYYAGGITTVTANAVYRYDLAGNSWTTMAPLQTARTSEELMASPDGSSLFAVMGGDATFFTGVPLAQTVEIYNIAGNSWTYGNPVTATAAGSSGGLAGGKLMVEGGVQTTVYLNTVQVSQLPGGGCPSPTPGVSPTPGGTPPPTPTPTPVATPTPSASPACTPNYNFTLGTGTMIPGTTRIDGVGCDDCTSPLTLPFTVNIYGTNFSAGTVGSNGVLAFGTNANAFAGSCLPVATATNELMPFYRDQRTDCTGGCGIFTATTGSAPNRVFTVEYKTIYFGETSTTPTLDYEVNFYENGSPAFDYTYGVIAGTTQTGRITSIGVQSNGTLFNQFACDATGQTPPVTTGQRLSWAFGACGTPVPSPTPTPGASCTPGAWTAVASFPAPDVYGAAATSNGTSAWLAGGYSFTASLDQNAFRRYDLGTNTWTTLTPMPDAVSNASAVYSPINNKVYVFGGGDATTGVVSNATRIYDVAAGTWSAGTSMPDVRGFMAEGYFNGKIYLVGGYSTGNISPAFAQVWEYDPIANTFNTTRLDMPATLGGAGSAVINGHLYVAGGRDATNTVVGTLYDYDIAANTWTTRAPMPSVNNVPGCGVLNGQLWIYGGGNPFNAPETTGASVIYDPGTNAWTTGPSLNEARSFVAGTNIGNTLFAAGGYNGTTTVTTTETLSGGGCPSPTPPSGTPSPSPSCPPTITESSTQTITPLNSVSCNNGTGHTDNSYWRAFDMNTFVGSNSYNVSSVSFGIEQATGAGGTQPVTVRLHTSNQPFPTGFPGSLTQIATATVNVPDSASNTVFTVPITATVPAGAILVMEVFTPDGTVAGNLLFIGSNADPESGPSYLSAAGCGINTPTTTAAIGFPNMHIVFNVNGSCGGGVTPTPGITPTPSASASASVGPSTTPCSGGSDVIVDGSFENGGIPSSTWDPETSTNFGTPLCDFASCGNGGGASPPRTGLIWAWFGGIAAPETATIGQTVTIPSGGPATLHFWLRIGTVTAPFDDVMNVRVDGTIVQSYIEPATAETDYTERVIDLSAFANGASHALLFEYIGTSSGVGSYVVDDVSLIAGGACPSPTTTPIGGTPTPSPTCAPAWAAGPAFPAVGAVRAPGNYFSANGRFYSIGGRNADVAGADFTNPFEYNPATNAWTTKPSTIPDGLVNNMACGVLTVSGTPQIYCVGGSQSQVVGTTGRVFSYNPATDTFATLTGDEWPGSQTNTFLPGGFAVAGNKLYIIGSFNANATPPVMTAQVWQFDPTAAVGSKWLARADYPQMRGYVPAATIGGIIYTGGGSALDPTGALIDSVESFKYDPAANTWTAIANIPRATGETRAVVLDGKMWVLGGGRTAPNPSNVVNIYDPVANAWTTGLPFTTARRNFPADTDGTRIFLAGGYDSSGTALLNTMEIFGPGPCASPTPGVTPSPTPPGTTPTPTPPLATPTPTPTPPTGTPTPTPTPPTTPTPGVTPPAQSVNFSTRMHVEGGDKVGIGGFIVQGTLPKRVIVRAIGPSLTRYGLVDVLADPVLELHGQGGFITITNDNWRDSQEAEIQATGLPPTNNLESAIVATLPPGAYTAIVRGAGPTVLARTGLALVEVYDLEEGVGKLGNISTRAFVGTGDNIVIAGFILGNNGGDDKVVARGIGPSLASQGVPGPLADPTLQLRDANGALLSSNNDWQDDPVQAAEITAAGLAPSNDLESAIAKTLPPGLYTALLAGLNNGTGIGLVEVYDRGDGSGGPPVPTPTPGITPVPSPTPTPGSTPVATPTPPPTSPTPPAATPTPSPAGACTESFDSVTPPALPPGWTTTIVVGPPPGWATSAGTPDTVNNAFLADTSVISDKVLDRSGVAINSAAPVLSFRNNFDTEFSDGTYWDGGVLEVSSPNINGGAFTDVTDAAVGGSFVSGPYTGTIDNTANNPLADRDAWTGSSLGYIDTVVNLGPNLNGQTVTFRWRMGTDEATGAPGWRIDTLNITGASCP